MKNIPNADTENVTHTELQILWTVTSLNAKEMYLAATHSTDGTTAPVACVFAASYTPVLNVSAAIPLIAFNTLE